MNWINNRPENWEEIKSDWLLTPSGKEAFEAGADAMLEALKKEGTYGYMPGEGNGWHIFIPVSK